MENAPSDLTCFFLCQALARWYGQQAPEQHLLPSGARIFYYTLLALKRQGLVELAPSTWPRAVTDAFVAKARKIAKGLACFYATAVQLRASPLIEGAKLLAAGERRQGVAIPWKAAPTSPMLEEDDSVHAALQQDEELPLSEMLLAALVRQFLAVRLPISPVARPQDAWPVSLRLLKAQLIQEARSIDQVPSDEWYLYEEPLTTWLGCLVQKHLWVKKALLESHQPNP